MITVLDLHNCIIIIPHNMQNKWLLELSFNFRNKIPISIISVISIFKTDFKYFKIISLKANVDLEEKLDHKELMDLLDLEENLAHLEMKVRSNQNIRLK